MTCLEKYLQDHPNCSDEDVTQLFDDVCPSDIGIMADPEWCGSCASCVKCWNRQIPSTEPDPGENPQSTDAVNHPKHYGREGAMECIDEMVLVFGAEATMNFCLLNVWKYRYRAGDKGGQEDTKKSDWYLAKYKELKGGDWE